MKSLSLTLEVFQHCSLKCDGCLINKTSLGLPNRETLAELLEFTSELDRNGISLEEFELGPSDIISTANLEDIFKCSQLKKLVESFSILGINISLLYTDIDLYKDLFKKINKWNVEKIRLIIPIEIKQVRNEKYINRLLNNIDIIKKESSNEIYSIVFSIIVSDQLVEKINNDKDFFQLSNELEKLERESGTYFRIDYIFHYGRDSNFLSYRDNYINNAELLRRNYEELAKEHDDYSHLNLDEESVELIWRNYSIYYRPVLNDKMTVFDNTFLYKKDLTFEDFKKDYLYRLNNNIDFAMGVEDCSECPYLVECSGRLLHDLMKLLKINNCILGLKGG